MRRSDRTVAGDVRDFVKNPLLRRLILGEQPERPRQRHGGSLVAGSDECEKIAHDFSVAHAAPGFRVAGGEQEVEKVRLGRSFCTPRLDQAAHVPMEEIARLRAAAHRDALEFPDGQFVLLTGLAEGQEAVVLQLPARPAAASEAETLKRVAHAG
jgi:hypothetical protein